MKLLLDTHVILWWLDDDSSLGRRTRALISARENVVIVSMASLWEIAIKNRIGKLRASAPAVAARLPGEGFDILPVEMRHVELVETFRDAPHGDPFDHLLLAQAKAEQAMLVTSDKILHRYGVPCVSAA